MILMWLPYAPGMGHVLPAASTATPYCHLWSPYMVSIYIVCMPYGHRMVPQHRMVTTVDVIGGRLSSPPPPLPSPPMMNRTSRRSRPPPPPPGGRQVTVEPEA